VTASSKASDDKLSHRSRTLALQGKRDESDIVSTVFGALLAVIPPIALLLLGVWGVYGLNTGFTAAKLAGIVVIGAYAYVANRRAGLSRSRSVLAASFLLALAAGLVLLKHYFH
jgi:hypothetical protein